jgi:nitroimidazol reductase NimA-like FMN-containing flavoprotein (pyridoxamine 5'-phosphate oxidase superfamily)
MERTDLNVVKLPSMGKHEIDDLVERQMICRIAFRGRRYPYIAPFQYVAIGGTLFFHFTNYGKKMRILGVDSNVCVEIEEYEPDMSKYRFVALRGKLKVVTDSRERAEAINRLMSQGRRRLSRSFLAAHGFDKREDWSSLDPRKPLVIVKLEEVTGRTGLKNS